MGDVAKNQGDGPALPEHIDAKTPQPADADGQVEFRDSLEPLDLLLVHHAIGKFLDILDGKIAKIQRLNQPVHPDMRRRARLHKQVRRIAVHHVVKQVIESNLCHWLFTLEA